jgi:peptide/nickel transport system ATP-binding protein
MTVASEPLLAVDSLRVEFPTRHGTLHAVNGISFAIAPGEVLGVVGESGAGKSVTGSAVIGLLDPPGRIAGGEIRLGGRRIDNLPEEAMRRIRGREIGAVFQDPLTSLNPLYTIGRQLVETMRTHLPLSAAQARTQAVALLEEVGIPAAARRIDHYPHQFSGGMRQRVVIALALAAKPRLIIADEPTTALDVSIHPYTIGLMGSIPSIVEERTRLAQIDGAMPRLDAVPSGCAFHPRCTHAVAQCHHDLPVLEPTRATQAACWRPQTRT